MVALSSDCTTLPARAMSIHGKQKSKSKIQNPKATHHFLFVKANIENCSDRISVVRRKSMMVALSQQTVNTPKSMVSRNTANSMKS